MMETRATETRPAGSCDPTLVEESYRLLSPAGMQTPIPPAVFWAGLVLCGAMGGLCGMSGNKMAAVLIPGVFCAISMLIAPQISLYAFMAWQAWDGILLGELAAVMTPAKILAFVAILVCLLHYGRGKPASRPAVVVLGISLLYVLYGVLTAPAALDKLDAFRYAAQVLTQVVLIFFGLRVIDNFQRVRAILLWLIVGTLFASMVLLRYGESSQFGRATLGEYANPNTTAMAIGLAFAAIPGLWVMSEGKWFNKVLCIVSALAFAGGIVKTGSRSALLAALLAVGISVLITSRRNMARKLFFLLLILVVFIGAIVVALQSGMLSEKTQLRFESNLEMMDETGNQYGRLSVWEKSIEAWLRQQPVLGVGMGNATIARLFQDGIPLDVHSSLIGPFVEGGVIGGVIFWSLLVYLFFQTWARRRSTLGLPLLVMYFNLLLSCVTHTIHFTKWFWIPVFIILMMMEWVPEDREAAMAECRRARPELPETMTAEETPHAHS